MTRLSVNLNKVALLRNARPLGVPSVTHFAAVAIEAGARGITVHPRPDQRHIRGSDIDALSELLAWPPLPPPPALPAPPRALVERAPLPLPVPRPWLPAPPPTPPSPERMKVERERERVKRERE
jgi:pyridoxine 5-phosphate synthase